MTGTKCRGICNRYRISSKTYLYGQFKKCTTCDIFVIKEYERCFCCNSKLRIKPISPKDKRTKKGDKAFYKYDILMIRAKNEFRLFTKIFGERRKILNTVMEYLSQAVTQIEIIELERRQRPAYLKAKIKSFFDFTHKIRLTLKKLDYLI